MGQWDALGAMAGSGGNFANAFQQAMAARMQRDRQAKLDEQAAAQYADKLKQQEIENKFKERELGIMKQKADAGPQPLQVQMTPGRKAADMAFGKEYQDWTSGGFAGAQKGLSQLEAAKQALVVGQDPQGNPIYAEDISGGIRGNLPDVIRNVTNPKAVAVRDSVRSAVMNTLRATLGAQFTEKEGERIFNLAYDPKQPPKENVRRLDLLVKELKDRAEAKQAMADYFEQKGTLTGWQGRQQMGDIGAGLTQQATPAPSSTKRYKILSVE